MSVSDFQMDSDAESVAEALHDLEDELEITVQDGDKVHDRLANVIQNRFTVKLPKDKLEIKMKDHKIPQNCSVIKAPALDDTLTEKGLVDRNARKDDNRLVDVQNLIATATAALIKQTNDLNEQVSAQNPKEKELANKVIKTNGDIFAVLGMAQQELSQRRRFEISKSLPKDIASIATAQIQTGSDTLFGYDVERLIRNARDSYRAAAHNNRGGKGFHQQKRGSRYHPYGAQSGSKGRYQQSQHKTPFLGRSPYRGGANSRGENPRRGRGNFRK